MVAFLPLYFLLAFLNFLPLSNSYNKFCPVICTIQGCNSNTTGSCTACTAPWTWNSTLSTCQLLPTSGWGLVDTSIDINGGITPNNTATTTCSCATGCVAPNWRYKYYGNLTGTASILFTDSVGPQVPHYQIRIIFWMILIDNWQNNDKIVVTLNGNQSLSVNQSSRATFQKICGTPNDDEDYLRFDQTYTHNDSAPYTVKITTTNTASKWGVKQFIVLAKLCHNACVECFGALANQCYACEQSTPMLLSGTTCNQSCLAGYGMMFDGMNCVYCSLRCTVCFQLSYNCTACMSTGTYASFYLPYNFSCGASCPSDMYANFTDRVCYLCDPSCVSCKTLPTYCFQCSTTLGYAWKSYTCYNPCPIGTFKTSNLTNCSACSPLCIQCENSSTTCLSCTLSGPNMAYFLSNSCVQNCPGGYYKDTANGTLNTCKMCHPTCLSCTANPSPCQSCNSNYWFFNDTCGSTCPAGYFQDNATWSCLSCDVACVGMQMSMYFSDAINTHIYVDFLFTEDLDFSVFPYTTFQTFSIDSDLYTLNMFKFSYQILSTKSYRVIMEPKGYIFLYNATIYCQTIDQPGTPHSSKNGRPFKKSNYLVKKSLVWFVIKAPDMTDSQKKIINFLSDISQQVSSFTTQPYVQQIKKSGVFALLFSGAQITSCSVLVNNIPSQNLYQGVKFWATFVFFDVPKWEENSDKTKYAVIPTVSSLIQNSRLLQQKKRTLFDTTTVQWRFQRTGHTTFFIFDTYPSLAVILFSWLLLLIAYILTKQFPKQRKHMPKLYTLVHKVHQISILYLTLHTVLEWLYFDPSYVERWLSLGFCILANVYFLIYELYVYYDMIKYPVAHIGNEKYEYYVMRYGCLLRDIRYEEYDIMVIWSPKQWFRPYNYHILSYYKKLLMIASLPLFYHTTHAQSAILILLQAAEITRFCFVWPFHQKWRNIYRLVLECALQMFFICVMIQGFLVQEIMRNDENTLMYSIQMFYRFGWVGFGMVFLFNFGFIFLYVFDIVRGCKMSNKQLMDQSR